MIRPARPEDAFAIASIHVRGWQIAYAGILPAAFLAALSIEKRTVHWHRVLQLDRPGETFVHTTDDTVRGWVDFGPARHESATRSRQLIVDPMNSPVAEVFALYVEPDWRGRGFGSDLLEHAEGLMRTCGYGAVVLWVLEQNHAGRGFYEHAGYVADGARKTEIIGGAEAVEVRYGKRLNLS